MTYNIEMTETLPPLTLPTIPYINLPFLFSLQILMVIFVLFLITYLIVSAVLFYHWTSYGMRSFGILVAETLFTIVSVTLFTVAGLALHYF